MVGGGSPMLSTVSGCNVTGGAMLRDKFAEEAPHKNKGAWTLRPPFRTDGPRGWVAPLPRELHPLTDRDEAPYRSPLRLREDGREVGAPHAVHETIRRDGRGHYSFWNDSLYFSTSDGSDPNASGRLYEVFVSSLDQEHPQARTADHALSRASDGAFDL